MRSMVRIGVALGAVALLLSASDGAGAASLFPSGAAALVPMTVRTVGTVGEQYVVLLEDAQHKLQLPISIGPLEALAIDRRMRGEKPPRPLTHDLLESTVTALGAKIERVEVIELRDDVFIGRLTVRDGKGQAHAIDARPSDLIALALGNGLPVWVAPAVLAQAAAH